MANPTAVLFMTFVMLIPVTAVTVTDARPGLMRHEQDEAERVPNVVATSGEEAAADGSEAALLDRPAGKAAKREAAKAKKTAKKEAKHLAKREKKDNKSVARISARKAKKAQDGPGAFNDDPTELDETPACSDEVDHNCCFAQEGVDMAKELGYPGYSVGECAAGGKKKAGDQWTKLVTGLVTCRNDACRKKALPDSKECSDYACPIGWKSRNAADSFFCNSEETCRLNCCESDYVNNKTQRIEVLSFASLFTVQNVTRINTEIDLAHKDGKLFDADVAMELLTSNVAGLYKIMKDLGHDADQYCPEGEVKSIRKCVHNALCIIEEDYDGATVTKDKMHVYSMLMEAYAKFADITWESLLKSLNAELVGEFGKTATLVIDKLDQEELKCLDVSDWLPEAGTQTDQKVDAPLPGNELGDINPSLLEAGGSAALASAYRASAALREASMTTHEVLAAHTQNSSVDTTVAALEKAWKAPCQLMGCDHTNYWDIYGASHDHTSNLIELGSSAHHLKVHIRTSVRLDNSMMVFLSKYGAEFVSRIYRTGGTTTEEKSTKHFANCVQALGRVMNSHVKTYGVDSVLLSLVNSEQIKPHFDAENATELFEGLRNNNVMFVSDEAELAQIQATTDHEEPDEGANLMESSHLDRTLVRKGFVSYWADVGKGFVTMAKTIVDGIVAVVTAVGKAIKAFVDFIISLLKCFGWETMVKSGYGKSWGTGPPPAYPVLPPYFAGVAFTMAVKPSESLTLLFSGQPPKEHGIELAVVIGTLPGTGVGLRIGLGVSAGIECKDTGCWLKLGVGIVLSGCINAWSRECIRGRQFWVGTLQFKCVQSLGATLKILCCNIGLGNGETDCGGGSGPTFNADMQKQIDDYVHAAPDGGSCDETLSGDGTAYRGCQTRTKTGRICQKWTAQFPHKHNAEGKYYLRVCGEGKSYTNSRTLTRGGTVEGIGWCEGFFMAFAQIHINKGKSCVGSDNYRARTAQVKMKHCDTNKRDQHWAFRPHTHGGEIRSWYSDGKCLESNQRNRNGGRVQLWDCSQHANREWLYYSGKGHIKMKHGKCLDVNNNHNANGGTSDVHMWDCSDNNDNQMWSVSSPREGGHGEKILPQDGKEIYTNYANKNYYLLIFSDAGGGPSSDDSPWHTSARKLNWEEQEDGSFGVYTNWGGSKNYLRVCGDNQATRKNSMTGWCEKFWMEAQHGGTYGLYTYQGGLMGVGNHNYCRNPLNVHHGSSRNQNHNGIWCYTLDANVPYEACYNRKTNCYTKDFNSISDNQWSLVEWKTPMNGECEVLMVRTTGVWGAWGNNANAGNDMRVRTKRDGHSSYADVSGHNHGGKAMQASPALMETFGTNDWIVGAGFQTPTWGTRADSKGWMQVCCEASQCPIPPKSFEDNGRGNTGLNNNHGYDSFAEAWDACWAVSGCQHILSWTNGKFFLRRDSDPIASDKPKQGMRYTCK